MINLIMIGVSFRDCELNISSDSLDHVHNYSHPRRGLGLYQRRQMILVVIAVTHLDVPCTVF